MIEGQWKYVQKNLQNPEETPVFIDLGFIVSTHSPIWIHCCIFKIDPSFTPAALQIFSLPSYQVTSKYGTEETQAAVDYALYSPSGQVIHSDVGVTEEEYGGNTKGSYGPWKICFRVSSGALLRPSVTVSLQYFIINYEEFLSDGFGEEDAPVHHHIDPKDLGTKEQIEDLEHGLLRLDHYLLNVTHEQRYLYSRTVRHLRTAESTLRRTFWYYMAIYTVICLAAFSQLVAVRMMFKKSRKQGLII